MKLKTNKKTWLYIAVAISVVIAVTTFVYTHTSKEDELLRVEVVPFKTDMGWGYDVKVDNKIFIHQQSIPAIAGDKSFASKEDALKTGNVVMKKLLTGKLPALSPEEVVALGVYKKPEIAN